MSDIDSELIEDEVESIYSQGYRETKEFKDFLNYLCDKEVCLGVVKCKKKKCNFLQFFCH